MKTIVLFIVIFALYSCSKNEPKKISCKKFDAQCEQDKDYQIIKVLKVLASSKVFPIVDCYGLTIKLNQWYIYSKKASTLIPAPDGQGHYSFNDYELADNKDYTSLLRNSNREVYSDTIDITYGSFPNIRGDLKVKMLLFGNYYVDIDNHVDGIGIGIAIREGK